MRQEEYADNTACAYVCKSWQALFFNHASELHLRYGVLRPPPDPAYLRRFTTLDKLTLHDGTPWQHKWVRNSFAWLQPQTEAALAVLRSIPTSCSQLALVNLLCPRDRLCTTIDGRQLSHLTNLQHLTVRSTDLCRAVCSVP